MIVPYSQTTIRNKTVGIKAATPRPSVNIATIIDSDTGRTDRVTLTNQNDIIDNYLTGTAISADDNQSIQCLGAMLTNAPVDVIRVNRANILTGVGSMGNIIYFNKNFNLIKELTKAILKESTAPISSYKSTIENVSPYEYEEVDTMPEPSSYWVDKTVKYIGDDGEHTKNNLYKCQEHEDIITVPIETVADLKIAISESTDTITVSDSQGTIETNVFTFNEMHFYVYESTVYECTDEQGDISIDTQLDTDEAVEALGISKTVTRYNYVWVDMGPAPETTSLEIEGASIADMFKRFNTYGIGGYYNDLYTNVYSSEGNVTIDSNINDVKKVNINVNSYGVRDSNNIEDAGIGTYMNLGNTSFIYTGTLNSYTNSIDFDNPVFIYFTQLLLNNISCRLGNAKNNLILIKILDYIYRIGGVQLPFGIKSDISINGLPEITNITGDFKLLKYDSESTVNYLNAVNGNVIVNKGSFNINGYIFYLGDAPEASDPNKLVDLSLIVQKYDRCIKSSTYTLNTILMCLVDYFNENRSKFNLTNNVVLTFNENTKFYYNANTVPTIYINKAYYDSDLTGSTLFCTVYHPTDDENQSLNTYDENSGLWISVDDSCYYYGNRPTVTVVTINNWNEITIDNEDGSVDEEGRSTYTMPEFIHSAIRAISEDFNAAPTKDGLIISGSHKLHACPNIKIGNSYNDDTGIVINQELYTDEFAIVCRFASKQDLFSYSYVANNDQYKTFNLNYKFKNLSKSYVISFDGLAMDGYGKSLYYDRYNEGESADPYIYIAKLDGSEHQPSFSSISFGSNILPLPATTADYVSAILEFKKYKDKQYQFIWDSGVSKPALAKAMLQVGIHFHAQVVPSYPVEYKEVQDILDYYDALGLNSYEVQHVVPGHKSNYNGDFMSMIPGSYSYIVGRINAFNTTSQEFIPLFGTSKGVVPAPNLIMNIDDDEKQELLNVNINSIVRELGTTYIVANATGDSVNSYLSEDQNVYMTNILAQVCDQYNPSLQGEENDENLWEKVISELTSNINQRMIAGKTPTVNDFIVVCDASLNPQDVVEARELIYEVWIQYTPTVAYVKAYTDVVRLNTI